MINWSAIYLGLVKGLREGNGTPLQLLLPGKSHGQRSLVGCSPWGHKESDTYWATSLSLFTFMHWRRKWQPIPVFLPGESQECGAWWAAIYGVAQSRKDWSDLAAAVTGLTCREISKLFSLEVIELERIPEINWSWFSNR